jgi:ABC-type transporter Mla subunit MlaD
MATKRRSDLRAGVFILASVALVFAAIVAIKGVRWAFVRETVRRAHFSLTDDLGGLRVGDDVRIGGFKVGIIRSIDVLGIGQGEQPYIAVRFTMPERYPLTNTAHLSVESSLTGLTWLNFDSLGDGAVLTTDQELTGHPSNLSALLAQIGAAAPDVRQIVSQFRTSTLPHIDAATAQRPETLASFHDTSERAKVAVDQFGSVFGDTRSDIRGTMANVHHITDGISARLPALLDRADKLMGEATTTIDDARTAMVDVRATVANTRQLTDSARDVVVNNRSKFDGIIASLKNTGDNLKEATAEIRRNPWRLLYQPAPGEMNNLALYDAARQFADGANHVDDAALALRDALQNPSTDKAELKQLTDRLNDSFGQFNVVEQKLWTTVKQP